MICRFQEIFPYKINISDFKDYVENVPKNRENHGMPPSMRKAKIIFSAIAVSLVEVERGFSKMNVIYSEERCRLLEENVSDLMTINLLGLTQEEWDHVMS